MKTKALAFIVFISILCEMSLANISSDIWDRTDREILRLQPEVFTSLPDNILKELKDRHCTIPQSYASSEPHNVIQGLFHIKGQMDWAVLCSIDNISSILVFWPGDMKRVSEIAKSPDKNWLQGIGNSKIGYSRHITTIDADSIGEGDQDHQGPMPAAIDHDGIRDAFLEKGSVVYYWHNGNWLQLWQAD